MADPQEITKIVGLLQSSTNTVIPDNVSPLDAAVLKESPVLPPLDYTNLDFSSIKLQLVNLIKANASAFGQTASDFSDANTTGMMLNTMSYMGQLLSYHTDSMVNELFLDTAQSSWAVSRLLNMYAYKLARPLTGIILVTATRQPASVASDDSKPIVLSPTKNRYSFTLKGEKYELFPAVDVDGTLQPDLGADLIIPAYSAVPSNAIDPTTDDVLKNTYTCFALSGSTITELYTSSGDPSQVIQLARGPVNDSDVRVLVDDEPWREVQHLSLAYMGSTDNVKALGDTPFLTVSLPCSDEFLTKISTITNTIGLPVAIDYNDTVVFADYSAFAGLHVPYRVGILTNTPSKTTKAEVILYHPTYTWNTAGPDISRNITVQSALGTPIEWGPGEILYLTRPKTVIINGIQYQQPMFVSEMQLLQANPAYTDLVYLREHPYARIAVGRSLSNDTLSFGLSSEIPTFITPDKVFEPTWDGDFNLRIRFGNGIFGAIPPRNSVITVQYRVNSAGGTGANIQSFDLQKSIRSNSVEVILSNSLAGAASNVGESPDLARQLVHRHFATQDRIVSGNDFVVMSKRHNPSIKAAAIIPDTAGDENIVRLYTLIARNDTIDTLSTLEKYKLRRYLQQYSCIGVSMEIADGLYRNINLKVDVRTRPGTQVTQLKKDIEKIVRLVFDPTKLEMGLGIQSNAIESAITSIYGVSGVAVYVSDAVYTDLNITNTKTYYPFQAIPGYMDADNSTANTPDVFKKLLPNEIINLVSVTVNTVG